MTLVQFDNHYKTIYLRKPIDQVEPLTLETFKPEGSTALYDAIGIAVTTMKDLKKPVICIVLTDGLECASEKYSARDASRLIIERRTKSGWVFAYLGSNQDAVHQGRILGIPPSGCLTYTAGQPAAALDALTDAMSRAKITQDFSL